MHYTTIEEEIKSDFAKIFRRGDYEVFKRLADYYFRTAATLKKKDIKAPQIYKLWIRNVTKRLYIGIATELLLKAIYLKNGYNINKPLKGGLIKFPEKICKLNKKILNPSETYSLNQLIDNLWKVLEKPMQKHKEIVEGLKICKVYRNKEGHIAVYRHYFNSSHFTQIENSIKLIYKIGFSESLEFKISMTPTDGKGKFKIRKLHFTKN